MKIKPRDAEEGEPLDGAAFGARAWAEAPVVETVSEDSTDEDDGEFVEEGTGPADGEAEEAAAEAGEGDVEEVGGDEAREGGGAHAGGHVVEVFFDGEAEADAGGGGEVHGWGGVAEEREEREQDEEFG